MRPSNLSLASISSKSRTFSDVIVPDGISDLCNLSIDCVKSNMLYLKNLFTSTTFVPLPEWAGIFSKEYKLTTTDKEVILIIIGVASSGLSFIRDQTIADFIGVDRTSVFRSIIKLKKLEFIKVINRDFMESISAGELPYQGKKFFIPMKKLVIAVQKAILEVEKRRKNKGNVIGKPLNTRV